ncbi:hypothetical protein [Lentibacillus amyloliquefaciens]|nr:hypothetical protein [Lentibacillus amyloliquefaciens]
MARGFHRNGSIGGAVIPAVIIGAVIISLMPFFLKLSNEEGPYW